MAKDTHQTNERDGRLLGKETSPPEMDVLIGMLDQCDLAGSAAHERDCTSFMLQGWPCYPEAMNQAEVYPISDIRNQIEDLRSAAPHLDGLLDAVIARLHANRATVQ